MKRAKTLEVLNAIEYLNRSGEITDNSKKSLIIAFREAIRDSTKDQVFYDLVNKVFGNDDAENSSKNMILGFLA